MELPLKRNTPDKLRRAISEFLIFPISNPVDENQVRSEWRHYNHINGTFAKNFVEFDKSFQRKSDGPVSSLNATG